MRLKILARKFNFDNIYYIFVLYSLCVLLNRIYIIFSYGGWSNRAAFFSDGEISPSLPDFIFNEIVIAYLLARMVIGKVTLSISIILIVASFAYFTRAPLIQFVFALLFSLNTKFTVKIWLAASAAFVSFIILYIRMEDAVFDIDFVLPFFKQYAMVGFGRLIETNQGTEVNVYHIVTLLLKPLDLIAFGSDYFGSFNGLYSATRFAGQELGRFIFIPYLNDSYNAFGTILFPYFYILGPKIGIFLFVLTTAVYAILLLYYFNDRKIVRAYIQFLFFSGFIFSWISPFIWLAPFLLSTQTIKLARIKK